MSRLRSRDRDTMGRGISTRSGRGTGIRTRSGMEGRSSSTNYLYRQSRLVDGDLLHRSTNQRVFHECHICPTFHRDLQPGESFSPTTAQSLLAKSYRKREAHCHASMVDDRILVDSVTTTSKSRSRPWHQSLRYADIVDYVRSPNRPEYMALAVANGRGGQRYYQGYKFKSGSDAVHFVDFLNRARSDRNYRLYDRRSRPATTLSRPIRPKSQVNLDFETSLESVRPPPQPVYVPPPPQPVAPVYSEPPIVWTDPEPVRTVYAPVPAVSYSPPPQPVSYARTPSPIYYRSPSPVDLIVPHYKTPEPVRWSPPPPIRPLTPPAPVMNQVYSSPPIDEYGTYRARDFKPGLSNSIYFDSDPYQGIEENPEGGHYIYSS